MTPASRDPSEKALESHLTELGKKDSGIKVVDFTLQRDARMRVANVNLSILIPK